MADALLVKSASRVGLILEVLSRSDVLHSELAAALDMPKSSVSGLLATLQETELVSFDADTKRYSLGPQILKLAGRYLDRFDLTSNGQRVVRQLSAATDESAALCLPRGPLFFIVAKQNSQRPLMRSMQIGEQGTMSNSSAGRAVLAFLEPAEVAEILSRERKEFNLKTNPHSLQEELAAIRRSGIAFSRDEILEGISGLATPVIDAFRRPVASLSVAIPTARYNEAIERRVIEALQVATNALSASLGGIAPQLAFDSLKNHSIAALKTQGD